jgi:hypothetical protein
LNVCRIYITNFIRYFIYSSRHAFYSCLDIYMESESSKEWYTMNQLVTHWLRHNSALLRGSVRNYLNLVIKIGFAIMSLCGARGCRDLLKREYKRSRQIFRFHFIRPTTKERAAAVWFIAVIVASKFKSFYSGKKR